VYKVYPLPDSLRQYVWNFDDSPAEQEESFIDHLLQLPGVSVSNPERLKRLLLETHERCRRLGEDFAVSLRDIKRFARMFMWWNRVFAIASVRFSMMTPAPSFPRHRSLNLIFHDYD
jgi:hypothetical protein